jgi:hypothetical protein
MSDEPRDPVVATSHEKDTAMTGMYIAVFVIEAAILALLWWLGKVYS